MADSTSYIDRSSSPATYVLDRESTVDCAGLLGSGNSRSPARHQSEVTGHRARGTFDAW